jgi:DNA-binding LacI/PurR family transcriptional regulator
MAPDLDPSSPALAGAWTIPTVFLNPEAEPAGIDSISLANYEGAFAVVSHLVRLGHRQIATVTGPERNIDARQRLEGYRAALRRAGLEPSAALETPGRFSERSGYEAGIELAGRAPRPTAVFAANDHMAVGVMGAMQDAGLSVPGDVAVAGFDDIPMARYLNPPLTTVHVEVLGLGQRAVELLLHPDREHPGRHETLATTLVVRGSCGAKPPAEEGPGVRWERRHLVAARTRRDPKDDAEG